MKKTTNSYSSFVAKDDSALVRVLSEEIVNAEDDLIDFDITERNPNYSQNHVTRERARIRAEINGRILETV